MEKLIIIKCFNLMLDVYALITEYRYYSIIFNIIRERLEEALEFFKVHTEDFKALMLFTILMHEDYPKMESNLLERFYNIMNDFIDGPKIINRLDYPVINKSDEGDKYLFMKIYEIYNFTDDVEKLEKCFHFMVKNEKLEYARKYFYLLPNSIIEKNKDFITKLSPDNIFNSYQKLQEKIKELEAENKALRAFPGGPDYQKALQNFNELWKKES